MTVTVAQAAAQNSAYRPDCQHSLMMAKNAKTPAGPSSRKKTLRPQTGTAVPLTFRGEARALSSDGMNAVCSSLGVTPAEIWTVVAVETSQCGFIVDRRPEILYERHIFSRLTRGQFDDGDISHSQRGGYGATGAHQYDRLTQAMAKCRNAALLSTSWGIGQVMGENFSLAGFPDVESMVVAMLRSEDDQLKAMCNFIKKQKLHIALANHAWADFARGYNGPNFADNYYHARLNAEFQKFSSGIQPDINVRAAQLYLTYLGFHPGPTDGVMGKQTRAALNDFQQAHAMTTTSTIDGDIVAKIAAFL
jgi:N-acetylmuramidase/Putative peptidoglycan binding domain